MHLWFSCLFLLCDSLRTEASDAVDNICQTAAALTEGNIALEFWEAGRFCALFTCDTKLLVSEVIWGDLCVGLGCTYSMHMASSREGRTAEINVEHWSDI